jgi:peptidoglycan/xylan/chitin deacetylase (PgdA/CDA1 family)
MLTFDDGGRSAHALIADLLEQRGWRGHFFITTNHIGAPSFVTVEQIRDLDRRGHIVGSHSCSHPARMSACSAEEVLAEWQRSAAVLADVLGKAVPVASVPGGFYSRAVAHAAAQAGFRFLFTSEPTASWHRVDGCLVLGRYSIDRGTSATIAAALASGRCLPRWRQSLLWNVKKVAKAVGGRGYAGLRRWLLTRAHARDSSRVRPT